MNANPWYKQIIPVMVILVCLISYFVYYNITEDNLKANEKARLINTIEKQAEIDESFNNERLSKNADMIQQQIDTQKTDNDGDGLIYSEELLLGTDDNNPDSDGDGIQDNEDAHPAGGGNIYKYSIKWQHNKLQYTTQFGIQEDWYHYYKNKPRKDYNYQDSRFATPNDITIKNIANDIVDISITTGETCKHCIAIDFVESMTYQYDIEYNNNRDYPKYAIETIIDERGDCEDTSFLMASILEALNIDTVLFLLPTHMAIGVYCTWCSGEHIIYNGRKYYFLETTGHSGSWQLGKTNYDLNKDIKRIIDV
jgi:hypothetical protein